MTWDMFEKIFQTPANHEEAARRLGVEQGFAIAKKFFSAMAEKSGHGDLAERIRRTSIERKS